MKMLLPILAVLFAVAPARADQEARLAALEAQVAQLLQQNLSLKAALEAVSGRTLADILASQPRPAAAPAPPSAQPDPARLAAAESIRKQIAAIQARHAAEEKRARDPFADRPSGIRTSAADQAKAREAELREISRLRAQLQSLGLDP